MLNIKRILTGALFASLGLNLLATSVFAGGMQHQPKGYGQSYPSNDQNSNTNQNGTNVNTGIGNSQSVINNSTQYQQDNSGQVNTKNTSNSSSGATSGSSSASGSDVNVKGDTVNSKTDARSDGQASVILPSNTQYTNTYIEINNVCGVLQAKAGVTPQTNSIGGGLNIFGIGGGSIALSNQKFNSDQKGMLGSMNQNLSMITTQNALLMPNSVLAQEYLETSLTRNYEGAKYKLEIARLKASEKAAAAMAVNDRNAIINGYTALCSIYRTTPTMEAPSTMQPIEVPPVYQGPGKN